MLYQLLILCVLMLLFLNLIINLWMLKRPSRKASLPKPLYLISVLVPARNEEQNIETCVLSLLKQDYPRFEVIVLDDNSTDKTGQIIQRISTQDKRVRLISGAVLPDSWTGKCFACHQLSQAARGDWLLFIDADTVHVPHMLRATLDIAIKENVSMLSGFPRQDVAGLTQKIVIPILFYFAIMIWFPLWWLHRARQSRPTLAIGQLLLFKRESYFKIGGHTAVKSRIMEDVWFGIEMARKHLRTISIDLSSVVTTKMYMNLGTMTEGCIKWFYSVAALAPIALIGFALAAYMFLLAPFYWMLNVSISTLFSGEQTATISVIILSQISLILLMRIICDLRFKGWPLSFIFHPLGVAFLLLAVVFGASRRAVGAGVAWKDRVYHSLTHIK